MVALIASLAMQQTSLASDLETALKGSKLSGMAFHRTVLTVGKKHGRFLESKREIFRTRGNAKGIIVWFGSNFGRDMLFIWPEKGRNRVQLLERPNARGDMIGQVYWRDHELVTCGNGFAGGNWSWPSIWVFRESRGHWRPVQIYDSRDECAGSFGGNVHFPRRKGVVDLNVVLAHVREEPRHLGSAHAGPNLQYDVEWRYRRGRYVQTKRVMVLNALGELEHLASLTAHNQRSAFNARVPRRFQERLFKVLKPTRKGYEGEPSVGNTTNGCDDDAHVFVLNETLQVTLAKRRGAWRVSGIKPFQGR